MQWEVGKQYVLMQDIHEKFGSHKKRRGWDKDTIITCESIGGPIAMFKEFTSHGLHIGRLIDGEVKLFNNVNAISEPTFFRVK